MREVSVFCVAVALTTPVLAQDWNTGAGGNSARNALTPTVGPNGPNVAWHGSLEAQMAHSPVIEGNTLVVARTTSIENPLGGTWIVAHDLTTGSVLWQRQLPVDALMTDWHVRVSGIKNGLVFATRSGDTNGAHLYALRATDGEIVWRSESPIEETSMESLAFMSNGDLIVGNYWSVARIRATDGATMWDKPRFAPSSDSGHAAIFNDRIYVWEATQTGPCVTVLDGATGDRLYSSAGIGGGYIQQTGLMAGPDGTIYAPRTQNNVNTDFFVAFRDTGESLQERWRVPMGYTPFATFGVGPDGSVYAYSDGNEVIRLNAMNGHVMNRSAAIATDAFRPRMAIDSNGTIFLTNGGFEQGRLYALNSNLALLWSIATPNVHATGPALSASGLLVVSGTGTDLRVFMSGEAPPECAADWNGDGRLDTQDLFEFLVAFFAGGADFNGDGITDSNDVFSFLTPYLTGC